VSLKTAQDSRTLLSTADLSALGVRAGLGPRTWINGLSAKIFFFGATFLAVAIVAIEQINNATTTIANILEFLKCFIIDTSYDLRMLKKG
jgi:hypothetical protein